MKVQGKKYRTIWCEERQPNVVKIIDQRQLPHRFIIKDVETWETGAQAIKEMWIRGAPLIGAMASYSVYLAALKMPALNESQTYFTKVLKALQDTRPTAINLKWALDRQLEILKNSNSKAEIISKTLAEAELVCEIDIETNYKLGQHCLDLIEKISKSKNGDTVNILTHCNAGWLATVDWGTISSGIYQAQQKGIKIHVWVDETRPRNQGARLTAWELGEENVPHTIIVDNAGGHLMQIDQVDLVLVGSDRTVSNGDVANKIGTYLKALAAHDNNIPFYVALPSSTIDWSLKSGFDIPIEQRNAEEVSHIYGLHQNEIKQVLLCPPNSPVANYAFDVTPAKYVTGLITERGVCSASTEGLANLFPENAKALN